MIDTEKVDPDRQDYDTVKAKYGSAKNLKQAAHFYRLAQAEKIIRVQAYHAIASIPPAEVDK